MKDKVLNSIAIVVFLVFVAMPLLTGCKVVHEPLQGLCYTDERGTYLCNVIDSIELEIERKLEEDIKEHYIDPTDPSKRFVAVDVKIKKDLDRHVTLEEIKGIKSLQHLALVKQNRLSVMPIDENSWIKIIKLSKN